LDPVDPKTGRNVIGKRELRKGECSFFLKPLERLESGIQNVYVLGAGEALLLRARELFKDGKEARKPGDRWMIFGPCDYVPPVTVEVMMTRKTIPLDENEGIYVLTLKLVQLDLSLVNHTCFLLMKRYGKKMYLQTLKHFYKKKSQEIKRKVELQP